MTCCRSWQGYLGKNACQTREAKIPRPLTPCPRLRAIRPFAQPLRGSGTLERYVKKEKLISGKTTISISGGK